MQRATDHRQTSLPPSTAPIKLGACFTSSKNFRVPCYFWTCSACYGANPMMCAAVTSRIRSKLVKPAHVGELTYYGVLGRAVGVPRLTSEKGQFHNWHVRANTGTSGQTMHLGRNTNLDESPYANAMNPLAWEC